MILFPNAKINLGLKVTGKRADGFHDIETVFYPVGLCDILEATIACDGEFSFHTSGLPVPGDPENNLCVKAFQMLAKEESITPVKIHLHKVIPMGAGTGGGSADAACMIKLLNSLFGLELSDEKMESYAARLGSDCAFFIGNKPAFATGRGDLLTPVDIDLSGYKTALVVPDIHVDTRQAYEWIDLHFADQSHMQRHHPFFTNPDLPVERWKEELVNDFEQAVFSRHPEIQQIKSMLYSQGAVYASMTGSGAAVYGIFKNGSEELSGFGNSFVWMG